MQEVLIMLIVFSVPLAAILSGTYLKAQRLRAQAGPDPALRRQLEAMSQALERLTEENARLRRRVENLETIVTSYDWDTLGYRLREPEDPSAEEQAARLARRILNR
mgnify:CR=1 FL=1|jgi:cell division protein FtsB|nr:MAG: hypothetical protein KatS3mg041_1418 [Bacteroidota bacterium]